jgi:hypothetical protein
MKILKTFDAYLTVNQFDSVGVLCRDSSHGVSLTDFNTFPAQHNLL